MLKRFRAKFEIFRSKYKITEKSYFFIFFVSNTFSGDVDWTFGHPAVNFWQSPDHFCSKYENQAEIIVSKKKNAQKIPLETPSAATTTPAKLFCPKSNFFYSKYKITKKSSFFLSFSLSKFFSGHVDWSFENPAVNVWQSPELFRSKRENLSKSIVFPMKKAQNFPLNKPNAVLIPPVELSCPIVKKNFWLINKFYQKNVFFEFFFSNCFAGHVGCGFENLVVYF